MNAKFLLLIFLFMAGGAFGGSQPVKMSEPITGKAFRIIQAAIPEAQKRNLNLDLYKMLVTEDRTIIDGKQNDNYVVSIIDANAPYPPTHPGNPGKLPGIEVVLEKETLKVIKAHFIR